MPLGVSLVWLEVLLCLRVSIRRKREAAERKGGKREEGQRGRESKLPFPFFVHLYPQS